MKSIILAAGYATRLYPLTKDFPKPLLKVGESSILDRLINDIDAFDEIDEHIIISNHRFISHFEQWKACKHLSKKVTILDDGSTENENRLGAVKDIAFAIETLSLDDDILVLAGDNVLDFSLEAFINYFANMQTTCIMRHYEGEKSRLQKTGVVIIDDDDNVLQMQEKPSEPASNWAVPPFYLYQRETLPLIVNAVKQSVCNTDAPGDFIAWFCSQRPVHAWKMSGKRYDIGDIRSYEEVQKIFQRK